MAQNLYEIEQIVLPNDENENWFLEGSDWSSNLLSEVNIELIKSLHITAPPGSHFLLNNGLTSSSGELMIGPSGYFNIKIENEDIYMLKNLQINQNDYETIKKNNGYIIVDIVGARGEVAETGVTEFIYDGGVVE